MLIRYKHPLLGERDVIVYATSTLAQFAYALCGLGTTRTWDEHDTRQLHNLFGHVVTNAGVA